MFVRTILWTFTLLLIGVCLRSSPGWSVPLEPGAPYPDADQLLDEIDLLLSLESLSGAEDSGNPEELFARYEELVKWLTQVGDQDNALLLAKQATVVFPEESRCTCLLGWIEGVKGNVDKAIECLEKGIGQENPILGKPPAELRAEWLNSLGGFQIQKEDYQGAVKSLEQARDLDPEQAMSDYLLGTAYFSLGNHYPSTKSFERGLQKDPSLATPEDYFLYVQATDRMKQYRQADRVLRKATLQFPNVSGFNFNWGLNAEARGATPEAFYRYKMETLVAGPDSRYGQESKKRVEEIEKTLVESDEKEAALWNLIRYLKIEDKRTEEGDLESMLATRQDKMFEDILKQDSREYPYLYHLQVVGLEKRGKSEEALRLLREAELRFPEQVVFVLHEADLLLKQGKEEEAEPLLNKALMLAPDHWMVEEAIGPSKELAESDLQP